MEDVVAAVAAVVVCIMAAIPIQSLDGSGFEIDTQYHIHLNI